MEWVACRMLMMVSRAMCYDRIYHVDEFVGARKVRVTEDEAKEGVVAKWWKPQWA